MSSGTDKLLADMMKKSGLRPEQMKHIQKELKGSGGRLPTKAPIEGSYRPSLSSHKRRPMPVYRPQNMRGKKTTTKIDFERATSPDNRPPSRSCKTIISSGPTEKEKLQKMMETHGRVNSASRQRRRPTSAPKAKPEKNDVFFEVMGQIDERKDFLDQMKKMDQLTVELENQIKGEIAERLRYLKDIDKARKENPNAYRFN